MTYVDGLWAQMRQWLSLRPATPGPQDGEPVSTCGWCRRAMPPVPASDPRRLVGVCPGCYGTFLEGLPEDSAMVKFLRPRCELPAGGPGIVDEKLGSVEPLGGAFDRRLRESHSLLALAPNEDATAGAADGLAQNSGLPATAKAVLAVMFTDIVGSTEFFSRKGDAAGMRMLEKHNSLLLPVLESYGGVLIKTIGDALMGCFAQPTPAAHAAVEMQMALRGFNRNPPEGLEPIRVRIGIHYGEAVVKLTPLVEDRPADVFGNLVNVASRVEGLAGAGNILVTGDVASQLDEPFRSLCKGLGPRVLKGISQPLDLFELAWE